MQVSDCHFTFLCNLSSDIGLRSLQFQKTESNGHGMIVNYDLKEEAVALQQAGSTVSLSSCGIPFLSCDIYNASLYIVLNKVFIQNISLFLALQSCPSLSHPVGTINIPA